MYQGRKNCRRRRSTFEIMGRKDAKMDNLLFSLSKMAGSFEIDTEYNQNDIVYIDLEGAEIEE